MAETKKSFGLRMDPDVHRVAKSAASLVGKSLEAFVEDAVIEALSPEQKKALVRLSSVDRKR